ncbi:MAG: D-alanine--D-alanine ligase [Pseudomonadota bacterium]
MQSILVGMTYDLRADHIADGLDPEDAAELDSEETIAAIEATLQGLGLRTERIGHARALCQRLVAGDRWDLVFNIAEGLNGRSREAQVPALLELYGVPYTFSDPLTCAVTLDKAVAKQLVRAAGLNTADFRVVRGQADLATLDLPLPVFAKPLQEGTGKGIGPTSRIDDVATLQERVLGLLHRHRQPVLVERYLPGREFTTGLVGTGADARVIGSMEVHIQPGVGDYGFQVKEDWRLYCHYDPLQPGPLHDEVHALALASYRALECRDGARVDIRLDHDGKPAFIEVNPLPGLNPHHSDLPMLARMQGMDFSALLEAIVTSALGRRRVHPVAA